MEQQIAFCTTSDGVSIAYATVGEGAPLVYVTGWPGHLGLEWEKPVSRGFLEDLAEGVTLIRYDMRGGGLSDHDVPDLSLDAWVKDLEAVIQKLQLDQFTLLALGLLAGPIAIICAAAHREQVSKLILSSAYLRGSELATPERGQAIADYVAISGMPSSVSGLDAKDLKKLQDAVEINRESGSTAVQGAVARAMLAADVSELAGRLVMPTLVMHGRHDETVRFSLGRALAAQLPNARFVSFEGSIGVAWRQQQAIVEEIRRFLGVETVSRPRPVDGSLVTILFTDMEGSTALTQRLGDAQAQEVRRAHNYIVRSALSANGGSEIKHTGDGIMASFPSASSALDCAIAIQRGVAAHVEEHPDSPLALYIGLNAGEPIAEERDLFGTSVDLTKRICDHAKPGQILASNVVRELAAGKGFLFADIGEVIPKGFEEPVRLYEVRWQEER